MFTKDIGIDLGTANTLVYMKGRGIIMREPSVVAVDPRSDELRVRSVGHEAKAVIGRAPGSIVAVRPLKDGVIADFDVTAAMLQSFIRQACGNSILARPRVVICVPSGVTEVERRAVRQAAAKAGARQVTVIEEPMAAAIGSGLPALSYDLGSASTQEQLNLWQQNLSGAAEPSDTFVPDTDWQIVETPEPYWPENSNGESGSVGEWNQQEPSDESSVERGW